MRRLTITESRSSARAVLGQRNRIVSVSAITDVKTLLYTLLVFTIIRIAGEGNNVADVLHSRYEEYEALEAEAEA